MTRLCKILLHYFLKNLQFFKIKIIHFLCYNFILFQFFCLFECYFLFLTKMISFLGPVHIEVEDLGWGNQSIHVTSLFFLTGC